MGADRVTRVAMGGLAAALLWAGSAVAQEPRPTSADSFPIYEREVFGYPLQGRRDPFRPLNAGEPTGPRFEDLAVSGVLYSPSLGSVATLTDEKTGKRYRARVGDSFGPIRVAEIRRDEVVFVVSSFGISRRDTLRVKKDKEPEA